jgi:hypothetical protein
LGTSKSDNKQAREQVQTYIRQLLGSGSQSSGTAGTRSASISLPKSSSGSSSSATPHALPRQLEATVSIRTSTKSSSGGGSGAGSLWLISPIASTVKSLLDLFGGGSSNTQTTRYRTKSRVPFNLVESISPETGGGTNSLNESAAALTGVTSQARPSGSGSSIAGGSGLLMNNRQELVTALRRSLSESRGIGDVLTEFQDGL